MSSPEHAFVRRSWLEKWFSFQGRMSRADYWFDGVLVRAVAFVVLAVVLAVPLGVAAYVFGDGLLEPLGALLALGFGIAYGWSELAISAKRLHDRERSGWWLLGMLVPGLNVWVWVSIVILPGTPGHNRFGPDPRRPARFPG